MMVNHPNRGRTIALAGNQSTAADVLRWLTRAGYRIDPVIAVGPEFAPEISDYVDMEAVARQHGANLVRPPSYAMDDQDSRALFEDRDIDLLVSAGWQRIIPEWLLSQLTIGAFGMHGSAEPLPRGRGRSPLNWSIIEGRDRFIMNLFRYEVDADAGRIVAAQAFDITDRDDIRSLQRKHSLVQARLLLRHLPKLLSGEAELSEQPDHEPTWYPKRVPDDGVLDWRDRVERVDRMVRAVTRPYPGAFTFDDGTRVFVWRGQPFDTRMSFEETVPGEIVAVFHDGTFVVRCVDHTYLVLEWEAEGEDWRPREGAVFESRTNPSWQKLRAMEGRDG